MTIQVQASRFGDNADKANLITVVHHVQRASSILYLSWSTTWIFHVQYGCPDLTLLQYSFRVFLSDHSERENSRALTNIVCSRSSNCSESTERKLNARTSGTSNIRVGMSRRLPRDSGAQYSWAATYRCPFPPATCLSFIHHQPSLPSTSHHVCRTLHIFIHQHLAI